MHIQILDGGALRFVLPNGQCFDSVALDCTQPLGDWQQLLAVHQHQGIHINRKGEVMDYGMAIQTLLQRHV